MPCIKALITAMLTNLTVLPYLGKKLNSFLQTHFFKSNILNDKWLSKYYLLSQISKAPPMIEINPTKRSCPSLSFTIRVKVSRQTCGTTKGKKPSITSIKPSAVSSVVFII